MQYNEFAHKYNIMDDKYIQSNKDKLKESNESYKSKASDFCNPKVNDTEMIKTNKIEIQKCTQSINLVKVSMQNCVMGN